MQKDWGPTRIFPVIPVPPRIKVTFGASPRFPRFVLLRLEYKVFAEKESTSKIGK